MKNKEILIQILSIKNILINFSDLQYPSLSHSIEEYSENLFDTVSLIDVFQI
ncbi:hypothetical protein RRG49_01630 [Mycoplasmopsis felis]|uniref:hypothetical protein n=1 Tax=Mycoplasmopsis felis TaxID=33923 RepID=UPI002AFE3F59|nr:hypothetical protein [Mycoplasmopsis felis]WQQ04173.1 hypothetical protein RRG47_01195 [Mycoplasmopsis felis]WQQ06179.1 hypothetical protein RRG40_03730 [Mycoplasmopsis felis]WQQ08918.1 hypothetical protein RRG41_02175 [Mycoplasmopsis felis]WQQ11290.1 hypothetical protein RRG50_02460 [Mycoplasmopsis felis]